MPRHSLHTFAAFALVTGPGWLGSLLVIPPQHPPSFSPAVAEGGKLPPSLSGKL